jgi:hypothetical protein
MTAGPGSPPPDLYQVLGVGPAATGQEITRAWRARAEHPDARPRDAAARVEPCGPVPGPRPGADEEDWLTGPMLRFLAGGRERPW